MEGIEAQVQDDLALYFKDCRLFNSMIVYVYDHRDVPELEKYFAIKSALKSRSKRIIEVVIIRRPSMVPNRGERGGQ